MHLEILSNEFGAIIGLVEPDSIQFEAEIGLLATRVEVEDEAAIAQFTGCQFGATSLLPASTLEEQARTTFSLAIEFPSRLAGDLMVRSGLIPQSHLQAA